VGYEIVGTEPALLEPEAMGAYLAERNLQAARRVGDSIASHVEMPRLFPHIGPAYPPGSKGPNREINYKKYRIFYRVDEESERVTTLTLWHGLRDEPDLSS